MQKKLSKYDIYGFWGILRLFSYILRTRLMFHRARLIRFPIEVRGKKFIDFGINLTTGTGCRIEAFPLYTRNVIIKFGKNVEINDYVHIAGISSVLIGNNVLIASKVYISDIQHGCYDGSTLNDHPDTPPRDRKLTAKKVMIGDNVWIGEFVSVLPGVTIGNGTIVGSNSVVSKSLPPNVIAVGIPAKPIKKFNFATERWEKI
jgi:acetyltransferase-like isoleucine patch superfamily enzyme